MMTSVQTSALDAHTESELMRNINNVLLDRARTSIFIAHRLRTVVEAGELLLLHFLIFPLLYLSDLIIVMRDGQVVEEGTHEELLQKVVSITQCGSSSRRQPSE
jgi:ATP-binding cassette subfamily B (MDR/TAP) protein 7